MSVDRQRIYTDAGDFFALGGSGIMKLTRAAATEVMLMAVDHHQIVLRLEAGIDHHPGFEARLDGIADSQNPNAQSREDVMANNERMAWVLEEYIPDNYDLVIVSAHVVDPRRVYGSSPLGYIIRDENTGEIKWVAEKDQA